MDPTHVPKIIHQTWKNQHIPEHLKTYVDSWKKVYGSSHVFMFWDDNTIDTFIKENYANMYKHYANLSKPIMKSDFARYAILYKFGGVYADLDMELFKDFYPLLSKFDTSLYLTCEHPEHAKEFNIPVIFTNWFIVSKPICEHLMNFMKQICSSQSNDPLYRSGPMMITNYMNSLDTTQDITILPYTAFGPIPKRKLWKNEYTNKDIESCYGLHYYVGTWWKKQNIMAQPIVTKRPVFTIVTPTMGRKSLLKLKTALKMEKVPYVHFIMWDNKRAFDDPNGCLKPEDVEDENTFCYVIKHPLYPNNVETTLKARPRMDVLLRAYGITMARTHYIKCMDDDTWPEENHLEKVLSFMVSKKLDFCYCYRRMWTRNMEPIGIDKFEAIGEKNMFGYTLLDNSSTFYNRKAANILTSIYLDYPIYGDDRLTYEPLRKHCKGELLDQVLTNHCSQPNLEAFFKKYCTKEN